MAQFQVQVPAGSIKDADITGPITSAKQEQRRTLQYVNSVAVGTASAAETRVVGTIYGTSGATLSVRAGCAVAPVGDATFTVDIKKNGTTILSAPISLDSTTTAYTVQVPGTVTVSALADGNVITAVTTSTPGTGTAPQGVWCAVEVKMDATTG